MVSDIWIGMFPCTAFPSERPRSIDGSLRFTLYQTLVPVQQSSPPARIEPVLAPEKLRPEIATRPEGAAEVERPALEEVSTSEKVPAAEQAPGGSASSRRLLVVLTASLIVGASVLVLTAYAIIMFFYPA
jgi:hypothetical protein